MYYKRTTIFILVVIVCYITLPDSYTTFRLGYIYKVKGSSSERLYQSGLYDECSANRIFRTFFPAKGNLVAGKLAELHKNLLAVTSRFAEFHESFPVVTGGFAEFHESLPVITDRFAEFHEKLPAIAGRFAELHAKFLAVTSRFAELFYTKRIVTRAFAGTLSIDKPGWRS